jgi:hypothetical protein
MIISGHLSSKKIIPLKVRPKDLLEKSLTGTPTCQITFLPIPEVVLGNTSQVIAS